MQNTLQNHILHIYGLTLYISIDSYIGISEHLLLTFFPPMWYPTLIMKPIAPKLCNIFAITCSKLFLTISLQCHVSVLASQVAGKPIVSTTICMDVYESSTLLALCEGNPSVTGGFPHKGVSNAESVPNVMISLWTCWSTATVSPLRNTLETF